MRHSNAGSILSLAVLAVMIGIITETSSAQNTQKKPGIWQQMKDAAKQGGQQGQQQPQPGQQPGQRPSRPGQQPSGGAQMNDSSPIRPPAGTKIEEKILAPVQDRAN